MIGRPRIHAKGLSYVEKYGHTRDTFYSTRIKFTPTYYYNFYIKREHYKTMNPKRMREILIPILSYMTDGQQRHTSIILEQLKKPA